MGLTISYVHRTKNKAKIEELINDMRIFAENTGLFFEEGLSKGYVLPPSQTQMLDGSVEYGESPMFYDASLTHLANSGKPSVQRWFSIGLKSPGENGALEVLTVSWFKYGSEWICYDWHKLWSPGSEDAEAVAKVVVEMVAILEYVKKYYFPGFKIRDDFDFYVNYADQSELNKKFWRDIKAGKYSSYRRSDGTFPDYEAEYKAKRNHDVQNIFKSIGQMNQTFRKVEGMLGDAGYGKDQIVKGFKLDTVQRVGVTATYMPLGDRLVKEIHDTITGTKMRFERQREYSIPGRIERTLLRRRDGVRQHYHKRLPRK